MNWKPLYEWMRARHQIYVRRFVRHQPWPWTDDRILQSYRFCNVYRELDTVTQWVDEHIRRRYHDHRNLWFMLAVARQINWPDTLAEIMAEGGWPTGDFNPRRMRSIMLARQARGEKLYTGAYILNGQLGSKYVKGKDDKAYYTCHVVLQSVWEDRARIIAALHLRSLEAAWAALHTNFGWGPFTSYEVVCDLRYTRYLSNARDKLTWANPGPGAKRGLDRLAQRPKTKRPQVAEMITEMQELHTEIAPRWAKAFSDFPALELREIEHSLCEFDKYERTRKGQGRPRSTYAPPPQPGLNF